jgi:hypothetical protein
MLTKKHFDELAERIGKSDIKWTPEHIREIADFCRSTNPRFDRSRFVVAIEEHRRAIEDRIKQYLATTVEIMEDQNWRP